MTAVLKDDTELFKQFMDNDSFKRWLTDTVFGLIGKVPLTGVIDILPPLRYFSDYPKIAFKIPIPPRRKVRQAAEPHNRIVIVRPTPQ